MIHPGAQVLVRKGTPADATALGQLFRDSWELAYRGIIPHVHLEALIRRRDASAWRGALNKSDGVLVLDVGSVVAGYASFGRARGRGRYQGEIYELYVAPIYQGLGFGEHLFEASRHALDLRGLKGLVVWALADNEAACNFYWRRGGRPVARVVDKIGGVKLAKTGFGWP
jgi:ribosomal protein S18 acetylase RimI-like enzyme